MEPLTGRPSLKRHRPCSIFVGCFLQDHHEADHRHPSDDSDFFFLGSRSSEQEAVAAAREGRKKIYACCKVLSSWLSLSWWEEILPSRRRLKKRKVQEEEYVNGGRLSGCYYRPPPAWQRLVRRLRAAAKMASRERTLSFRYDPLSYSLNFDDGCWQHSQSHARLYTRVPTPDHLLVLRTPAFAAARPSLWQRRKVRQPLALDVTMDRV